MATDIIDKPAATDVATTEHTRTGPMYRPDVDIIERPDELTVLADMPGVSADEIDINFENGVLTIHGKVEARQSDGSFLRQEYGVGDFHRTFNVSKAIDGTAISAEYADGVLTLHLPKVEAVKPHKIAVKAS